MLYVRRCYSGNGAEGNAVRPALRRAAGGAGTEESVEGTGVGAMSVREGAFMEEVLFCPG